MKMQRLLASGSTLAVALTLTISGSVQAATTVVVSSDTSSGENQPGWMFNRDSSTATPFEFTTEEASIGQGSLYVQPIGSNAADKFVAENFINSPIADIQAISFDYKIGSDGSESDAEQFYMNVYANFGQSDDSKFYDCRYNVVPATGSTSEFTTVTFDPSQAYPVTQSGSSPFDCPEVPADMDLESVDSTIRMFSVNVGDTSASDEGIHGYLDNVVLRTAQQETIYDFELVKEPALKDLCKKGGFEGLTDANGKSFKNQGQCVSYFNHLN